LVAALDVLDLPSGWWSFDSTRCELVSQKLPGLEAASAAEEAQRVLGVDHPLPAVVFLVANLSRTLSRYPAGTSLVWRDAGVLLGLLHLCASDIGLGSCIAGMSGALPLDLPLVDVGAIALGTVVN
jgi:hypothetical protein